MRCAEFETRLNQLLDQRVPPAIDAGLRRHAHHCPDCADSLAAHTALLSAVRQGAVAKPSSDLSLRVLQSAQAYERQSRQRRWWSTVALAAAAVLLLAILPWAGREPLPETDLPALASTTSTTILGSGDYRQLAYMTGAIVTKRPIALVGEIAVGFKPVTQKFNTAIDALRSSLPANQQNHSS